MFKSVQAAFLAALEAERVDGGLLEQLKVIRWGDEEKLPDTQMPGATVDWDGLTRFVDSGPAVEISRRFEVAVYAAGYGGVEAVDGELQDLLWEGTGNASKGMMPALLSVRGLSVDGLFFQVRTAPEVPTGIEAKGGVTTAAAVIPVDIVIIVERPNA